MCIHVSTHVCVEVCMSLHVGRAYKWGEIYEYSVSMCEGWGARPDEALHRTEPLSGPFYPILEAKHAPLVLSTLLGCTDVPLIP